MKKIFICFLVLCLVSTFAFAQSADILLNRAAQPQEGKIIRVLSTDTFLLDNNVKIKLIGLKAPRPPTKSKNIERDEDGFIIEEEKSGEPTPEEKSMRIVNEIALNKTIRIEYDNVRSNDEGRTLAYAFLKNGNNEIFLNARIIEEGCAYLQIQPPNSKYDDQLREAYHIARQEQRLLLSK